MQGSCSVRKFKWIASFDTQNEAAHWILQRGGKLIPDKNKYLLGYEWNKFERKWDVFLMERKK